MLTHTEVPDRPLDPPETGEWSDKQQSDAIAALVEKLAEGETLHSFGRALNAGGVLTATMDEDDIDAMLTNVIAGREDSRDALRKALEANAPDYLREHWDDVIEDEMQRQDESDRDEADQYRERDL